MKDSHETSKSNKISIALVAIIAALVFVVIGLVIALVGKNKKDTATTQETTITVSEATTEIATATDEVSSEQEIIELDFLTVTSVNSWETDGRYYSQFDVKVTNSSNDAFVNWKLDIKVPTDTLLSDLWNGEGAVKNSVLSIQAKDYNSQIDAGATLSDLGFIISTKDKDGLATVGNEKAFYSDGKLVDGLVVEIETTPTEEATEQATEAVVSNKPPKQENGTPLSNHGKLSLKGTDIVDENGDKYQLKGLSTHGIAWFPEYVNKDAFQTFRDDWGANLIRLAMYTDENNGYCSGGNREEIKKTVCDGVEAASELGMYVIIDWHILHDLSPKVYEAEAKVYFDEMSKKYKDYDNVIYEICNEPNGGTTWVDVKEYAEDIIPIIRANDKDALIIVGTPTWSQDVDIAAQDPITGYDNIMYAVHFYAATHTDNIRSKVTTALNSGLPIFVSEFSICDASGNGAIDYGQAEKWFDLINSNNLSYAAWNISNKNETSSVIKASCTKTSGWTVDDLSETGVWIRKQILGN